MTALLIVLGLLTLAALVVLLVLMAFGWLTIDRRDLTRAQRDSLDRLNFPPRRSLNDVPANELGRRREW